MNTSKPTPRKWRLNYVIQYSDEASAYRYRSLILNSLENIAALRRIDYAIVEEYPFGYEASDTQNKQITDNHADLVYFRSSTETLSSVRDFRKLVDLIFQGHDYCLLHKNSMPFGVYPQLLKNLSKYPFPKDDFYHPLEYPYLEYHKDGKAQIYVPASTIQEVLDEMDKKELN